MKTLIIPIQASKRREVDSYSNGCEVDTCECRELGLPSEDESILAVMSELVGRKLKPEDVYTFDPNLYCDTKTPPGFRVVRDSEAAGCYRVEHDRLENQRGKPPTEAEIADFEADKITLFHATYELRFEVRVVGLGEVELAEFLGVTNHS